MEIYRKYDFFTRFAVDVGNKGLVNPNILAFYTVNEKLTLRADDNLFYSKKMNNANQTPLWSTIASLI